MFHATLFSVLLVLIKISLSAKSCFLILKKVIVHFPVNKPFGVKRIIFFSSGETQKWVLAKLFTKAFYTYQLINQLLLN